MYSIAAFCAKENKNDSGLTFKFPLEYPPSYFALPKNKQPSFVCSNHIFQIYSTKRNMIYQASMSRVTELNAFVVIIP